MGQLDPERQAMMRESLYQALENQMRDGTPLETKETFERLVREGTSEEDTMELMATVLFVEMFEILKDNRVFDEKKYVENLKALPNLSFE